MRAKFLAFVVGFVVMAVPLMVIRANLFNNNKPIAADYANPSVALVIKNAVGATCSFQELYTIPSKTIIRLVSLAADPNEMVEVTIFLMPDNHGQYSIIDPSLTADHVNRWGTTYALVYHCASQSKVILAFKKAADALGPKLAAQ